MDVTARKAGKSGGTQVSQDSRRQLFARSAIAASRVTANLQQRSRPAMSRAASRTERPRKGLLCPRPLSP
jgi:hypothetical protein